MRKPRVVLAGGSGLLALNWACAVRDQWDVVLGMHRHQVELRGTLSRKLNLRDTTRLRHQLAQLSPDLLVNAAGLANVDRCEREPWLARQANAEVARNLAQVAVSEGVGFIHISTDHLFAGEDSYYREDSPTEPLNEYARSKRLAEEWVLKACPDALIVRTNFFGWGYATRQSYTDWIIQSLRAGKSLSLFDDVYITPILADALAEVAHELKARDTSGIFNVVGSERISKYDLGLAVAERFTLPPDLIQRSQIVHGKLVAPRPRDMSLDNAKARSRLGMDFGCVDEYLDALYDQETRGRPAELFHSVSRVS